jgi:precorrin-6B methylase 1
MQTADYVILPDLVPEPEIVRRRLAVVLTEADLLRCQLRISERLVRERERLRQQRLEARHATN